MKTIKRFHQKTKTKKKLMVKEYIKRENKWMKKIIYLRKNLKRN